MKVQLQDKKQNCRAYGLDFDETGVANVDQKVAQSLLDTGALIEVKAVRKLKKNVE